MPSLCDKEELVRYAPSLKCLPRQVVHPFLPLLALATPTQLGGGNPHTGAETGGATQQPLCQSSPAACASPLSSNQANFNPRCCWMPVLNMAACAGTCRDGVRGTTLLCDVTMWLLFEKVGRISIGRAICERDI